ncbi:MAG TPA: OmpA family protein [Bacteroidia bacterium]|nr:OmpA family protein [Bacteroidia bacterium]
MRKIILLLFLFATYDAFTQEKQYPDGQGGFITLPQGDISFADTVIAYIPGNPAPIKHNANPKDAIGAPDFNADSISGFVSLGVGGELILAFTNNVLINIPGNDLYVFENGRYIEETYLYVSKDSTKWISVGKINGGNAVIDIGDSTKPGDIFRYIKLIDAKTKSHDRMWPGADIDAIAAIGSAKQISLNATYLFNTNQAILKPQAKEELTKIAKELNTLNNYSMVINGHCDSTGNKTTNKELSKKRALSVKEYLLTKLNNKNTPIICNGYSDEFPIATNTTPEGREKNRRVEIYIIPNKK